KVVHLQQQRLVAARGRVDGATQAGRAAADDEQIPRAMVSFQRRYGILSSHSAITTVADLQLCMPLNRRQWVLAAAGAALSSCAKPVPEAEPSTEPSEGPQASFLERSHVIDL